MQSLCCITRIVPIQRRVADLHCRHKVRRAPIARQPAVAPKHPCVFLRGVNFFLFAKRARDSGGQSREIVISASDPLDARAKSLLSEIAVDGGSKRNGAKVVCRLVSESDVSNTILGA